MRSIRFFAAFRRLTIFAVSFFAFADPSQCQEAGKDLAISPKSEKRPPTDAPFELVASTKYDKWKPVGIMLAPNGEEIVSAWETTGKFDA